MWSSFIGAVKNEYNAIHIWPRADPPVDWDLVPSPCPNSAYDESHSYPHMTISCVGRYRSHNIRISTRTNLEENGITLYGWPSRGGVIVLENATAPDFDYLHVDALDPPLRRDRNQDAEDVFCQGLLRLGAKWWDSEARRAFVQRLQCGDGEAYDMLELDKDLDESCREKTSVRVAWPSHPPGALWVLAWGRDVASKADGGRCRPTYVGLIALARTMDERAQVIQRLGGIMYASIEDYEGPTFLKAWEENHQGEKRRLEKIEFVNPSCYGGHPDEALRFFDTDKSSTQICEKVSNDMKSPV